MPADKNKKPAADAKTEAAEPITLDGIQATLPHGDPERTKQLLRTLTNQCLEGTITYDKNLTKTIKEAVKVIDAKLSAQMAEVMHAPELQKLEGSWRGLFYFVSNTMCSELLKIRLFNASKVELLKDMQKSMEFDQSYIFKQVYEQEYDMPGGTPYGLLIGDYELTSTQPDINFLTCISKVAASAFAPYVGGITSSFMGFETWDDLSKPADLSKIMNSLEYVAWRGFRESDEASFVALTMPRVLSRLPYGKDTNPVEEFDFEEAPKNKNGKHAPMPNNHFTWMNSSYVMGARMTESFFNNGWCTEVRGAEGGGKVENLPAYIFQSDKGDFHLQCPTEVAITDRREFELDNLGFIPFCHYKNTNYAVIFGGQTTQKPLVYDNPKATSNAAICARLPYVMVASRIAHHLKVMGRDKVGSLMELPDVTAWLNNWISEYVNVNPSSGVRLRYQFPLSAAKIQVEAVPGKPGAYNAIAWIRPWLALEELKTSIRLVAELPGG
ncbi:MAG: type VI secretion system contractile sheath large subunit [Gammaproteobacteria bacterium]|nr:type VI secretion system contractile sheath large subunit [Gammaproteobacteria bacterium]MCH9743693.1 type VI secretion system contractile sheath large subunit [Gammaproteobacteria bacterium]